MATVRRRLYSIDDALRMVLGDGVSIGAIVQQAGLRDWHWSITVQANPRTGHGGMSATREEALIELRAFRQKRGRRARPRRLGGTSCTAELAEKAKGWRTGKIHPFDGQGSCRHAFFC